MTSLLAGASRRGGAWRSLARIASESSLDEVKTLHRDRTERIAMAGARAVAVDRAEMLRRAVALVPREAVQRPYAIEPRHDPVADHLGHHGRGGDRDQPRVAVHHRALRARDPGHDVAAVHEHERRRAPEPGDRAAHRFEARGADVHTVD